MPLRSAIGIGSFSISSHLSAVANTSTLTMIFEDCGLFLSDKHPPKDGACSTVKVDLERDYVNVIEIALFEISIKTTDKVQYYYGVVKMFAICEFFNSRVESIHISIFAHRLRI